MYICWCHLCVVFAIFSILYTSSFYSFYCIFVYYLILFFFFYFILRSFFSRFFFFLMFRRPPISTRTDTLFPYTTLFRSLFGNALSFALMHSSLLTPIRLRRCDEQPTISGGETFVGLLARHLGRRRGLQRSSRRNSGCAAVRLQDERSEEHTSELQSLMRISYAVFCLKKQTTNTLNH